MIYHSVVNALRQSISSPSTTLLTLPACTKPPTPLSPGRKEKHTANPKTGPRCMFYAMILPLHPLFAQLPELGMWSSTNQIAKEVLTHVGSNAQNASLPDPEQIFQSPPPPPHSAPPDTPTPALAHSAPRRLTGPPLPLPSDPRSSNHLRVCRRSTDRLGRSDMTRCVCIGLCMSCGE